MFRSKIRKIIIFFAFFLIPLIEVKCIIKPTSEFYINDYANILSEETEKYILKKSEELNKSSGCQIVVITINNLEKMTIEDYSVEVFRKFGIGDSKKNNGLLFLIALEERKFRIEVGYGLEGILPDGKVGRLEENYIIPYFSKNKYDEAVKSGYDALYLEIVNNYPKEKNITSIIKDKNLAEKICIAAIVINILLGITFGVIKRYIRGKYKDSFDNTKKTKCNLVYTIILLILLIAQIVLGFQTSCLLVLIDVFICLTIYIPTKKLPNIYIPAIEKSSKGTRVRGKTSSSSNHGGGGSSGGGGTSRNF